MVIRTLFERVTRYAATDTASFLDFYNDGVQWLLSQYGEKYVMESRKRDVGEALSLDETSDVLDDYYTAMLHYILYLVSGAQERYAMAHSAAESAYRLVWRRHARGKILNIQATNDPYSAKVIREGGEKDV